MGTSKQINRQFYKELNIYSKRGEELLDIFRVVENGDNQYSVVMSHTLHISDNCIDDEELKIVNSSIEYYLDGILERLNGKFLDDWFPTISQAIEFHLSFIES